MSFFYYNRCDKGIICYPIIKTGKRKFHAYGTKVFRKGNKSSPYIETFSRSMPLSAAMEANEGYWLPVQQYPIYKLINMKSMRFMQDYLTRSVSLTA